MKQFLFAAFAAACFTACHTTPAPPVVAVDADSDWALLPFVKADSLNPVLVPGTGSFICPVTKRRVNWEAKNVLNPAVVVSGEAINILYRAQDSAGTSRIGIAGSYGGTHFERPSLPVLYPDNDAQKKYEWNGGCEDPRIVEDSAGTYYMTYTAFDGVTARLMVATSNDLFHWTKQGPAFLKALNGKYLDKWSKSGSIVSTYKDGRIIATRIHGKYWMYWGDTNIWGASSDDLINWTPVERGAGEKPPIPLCHSAVAMDSLAVALAPRCGKFDSNIVEPGPPAMITDKGILLIYNGRNSHSTGDTTLPEGTYATGQALLDKNDPTHLLKRMDHYFMKPTQSYEMTGQVNQVCFAEGLAQVGDNWLLYYGTADSKIAVAIKKLTDVTSIKKK